MAAQVFWQKLATVKGVLKGLPEVFKRLLMLNFKKTALHQEAIYPNIQVSSGSFQNLETGVESGWGVTVVSGKGLHSAMCERSLFQTGYSKSMLGSDQNQGSLQNGFLSQGESS